MTAAFQMKTVRRPDGDQRMDIKSLAELEMRALTEISVAIYGEELTRIMTPELQEYLDISHKRNESEDLGDD